MIEEEINKVKREIGRLFNQKYQMESDLKSITEELKNKQHELFELEIKKKMEDIERRRSL